jgi:hypothetical protein
MPARRLLVPAIALTVAFGAAAPALGAARRATLVFDAVARHASTAGPGDDHVGHRQLVRGILRDSAGHRIGRFHYACRWIRILSGGDADERCSATGRTADGTLRLAGPARESALVHRWHVRGGTGAYRGARGGAVVQDLGQGESVLTVRVVAATGAVLRAGRVPRPAANARFVGRAQRICGDAAGRLAALPPFPFDDFDPLHPDPALLPQVGAFFTGPGDPRPILEAAASQLQALGHPPAARRSWKALLAARADRLTAINAQDQAALAADVPAFVQSVHAVDRVAGRIALAAAVFGVSRCAS